MQRGRWIYAVIYMLIHSVLSNKASLLLITVISLTGACETGVAAVCSIGASDAGSGAETGAEAESKLARRVKGDVGRHSVRFMAGR